MKPEAHTDPQTLRGLPEDEAAAELYTRSLDAMGVIDTVWRRGSIVCATTSDEGVHLLHMAEDYDADVHLICKTEGVRQAGNLPDHKPPDAHGDIYFNVNVHGLADDPTGHGLPTHVSGRAGATVRDPLLPDLRALAEAAGLDGL